MLPSKTTISVYSIVLQPGSRDASLAARAVYLSGRIAFLAGVLFFFCQAPSNAQSGGDCFSSQGILPDWESQYAAARDRCEDPFSPEAEPANLPPVESTERTGDPFIDSCLFGPHHSWYHRTYVEYAVFDDATPWWQDYLDDAERFGCCDADRNGKPLSRVAALAVLLKENNINKTRQLRYTLRALYQLEKEPYERVDRLGVDTNQCQRYRTLCLSASQQSPLPVMRAYYRARAFAYTDEQDQLWASLRRLKSLTRNHNVFAEISYDLIKQQRFDESKAVNEFEAN